MSLRNWTRQNWVDVANKRERRLSPRGRRKGEKRKTIQMFTISKVRKMTTAQLAAAI